MTRSASPSSLAAASLLGVATGMRSLLPLALLSLTQGGHRGVRALLLPLAAAELVRDKLPGTGSRLDPVPLGARLLAGGIGAAWLIRSRRPTMLVLAGAAGALAGALLGSRARMRLPQATRTPDLPWAVLEDVTAAGLAGTAVRLASG
ncbi:MAG TPA: hypothetical protein VFD38_07775 [Myxococcaceae bacterium]|nr:hypothetical protein [Myxococcaceae bacterium]